MATPAPTDDWTCPTCGGRVDTAFCACCGERRLERRDLSMRSLFDRVAHALTSVDGRVLRTAWTLLRRPGALTVAYLTGRRKPFIAPLQVFLLANVVFFAIASFSAGNVFGAKLDSHLHQQDWAASARSLVAHRLALSHRTLADYAPVFDHAVERNAKTLVFLMTIPFALLVAAMFRRRRLPFLTHATFSLHAWAFLLIVFSFATLFADADALRGGAGLRSAVLDNVLTTGCIVACLLHMRSALGPVYGIGGGRRLLASVLLTLAVGVIVLGYRWLLFVITLYGTT
jgi:hypothetical protein